ncbi:MAG: HypC/HybG/HupF family hydrogenase formation chaperone [Phycisphaerae bacterium]|nr:HypC/HybG/HupF family hydrogenase formation chaperone [Phycisphaerae bacterium]
MCLAVAGKVIQLEEHNAVVAIEGNQVEVTAILIPEVKVGDHVLVHAGFAITIISKDDHDAQCELLREAEAKAQALFGDKGQ